MKIDYTPFEKALITLQVSLNARKDDDNFVRDSAIQRFEYTYEISLKILRRQLESMSDSPTLIEQMPFREMIRTAAEKGLIEDPVAWFNYREMRNITSHTYDEEKAEKVYAILPDFAKSTQYLLDQIKRLNS